MFHLVIDDLVGFSNLGAALALALHHGGMRPTPADGERSVSVQRNKGSHGGTHWKNAPVDLGLPACCVLELWCL